MSIYFYTNKSNRRIKNSTSPIHKRLGTNCLFKELQQVLPLESYVNYLQAMAYINGVLEKEILIANHAILNSIWKQGDAKLPSLLLGFRIF